MPATREYKINREDRFVHVVTSILIAIGVGLLVIAVIAGANTRRQLAKEQTAEGSVVKMVARVDPAGNEYYYPMVEFVLPNEAVKTVQLGEGTWPPAYEVGEAVTIKYLPEKPLNARIESTAGTIHLWTWSIILGALGVAFVVIPMFVRWVFKA